MADETSYSWVWKDYTVVSGISTVPEILLIFVCSSTIIHDVMGYCELREAFAICYFYFAFDDPDKKKHEPCVRSMIAQLAMQASRVPEALETLYTRCHEGQAQPSIDALMSTFQRMVQDFNEVFIIFDALDECEKREDLLKLVGNIVDCKVGKLHILAVSRKEVDITRVLDPLTTDQIPIQEGPVNADINTYLRERLENDPELQKWPSSVQTQIETKLMAGANGM